MARAERPLSPHLQIFRWYFTMALSIAPTGYIMETGKVVMDGPAAKLLRDEDVREFYLGLHSDGDGGRKSFRDVKHYKRRKRWLS